MRLIGITGSIACGKSTVSNELIRRGFPVVDGDSVARELTGPGGQAVKEIRSAFGDSYILPDGSMDRRRMGRLVFSDPGEREKLDRVMAPFLRASILSRIEEVSSSGAKLCFLDLPLLYEKGYDRYCDTVWCVWLPEELQLKRLTDRDQLSRSEALSRIHAVMSSDEKANLSTVVIDNSGTVENTLAQVSVLLETELARAESALRRRRPSGAAVSPPPVSQPPSRPHPMPQANPPVSGFDRSESARKKPSSRKASWPMPLWIRAALISLSLILAVSFTAQMLMNGYLAGRKQLHADEQKSIDAHYPLYYGELIRTVAEDYNLSPSLIAAVILNESSFNPAAVSKVGARGLMQLMPDTAEWIAHKMRLDDYSPDQLEEPDVNVRLGCWYLNYLSSLFLGDPLCVVCAYHAGQGEISSWLSNPLLSHDGITLIPENLPDGPTKVYAGRVTRDYGIYQEKYYSQDAHTAPADTVSVSD